MTVNLTKFRRTDSGDGGLLCKKVELAGGELKISACGQMTTGIFETLRVKWDDFGEMLVGLGKSEALGMGVCKTQARGEIITSKMLAEGFGSEISVSRTLKFFDWPAEGRVCYLDFDKMENESVMIEVLEKLPPLGLVWAYPSSGSCIYEVRGETRIERRGVRGMHVYFRVPAGVSVAKMTEVIETRLWASGFGRMEVSKSGSLLKRCAVDFAVFSPERLDFISGAGCGEGLVQERGLPVAIDLPGTGSWEVEREEREGAARAEAAARRAVEGTRRRVRDEYVRWMGEQGIVKRGPAGERAAHVLLDNAERGELLASWQVEVKGRQTHLWKLMSGLAGRDDRTEAALPDSAYENGLAAESSWVIADPLEPGYGGQGSSGKARLYRNMGSKGVAEEAWMIHSFAHGGRTWRIFWDYESVMQLLEARTVNELFAEDANWMRMITERQSRLTKAERALILKKIKQIGNLTSEDLKETLAELELSGAETELARRITDFNERFAVISASGNVRVLEEREDGDIALYKKQDFDLLTSNHQIRIGNKNKKLSEIWLHAKDRREYSGLVFEPGMRGGANGSVYNLFKGLAVTPVPVTERKCRGEWCRGAGCLEANLSSTRLKCLELPPGESGCIWFRKHIFEVLCKKITRLDTWVVDWCSDLVQNLGEERPGTAIVLRSPEEGTGKGVFAEVLGQIFGRHFMVITNSHRLTGRFNYHFKDVILALGDEVTWGGDKQAEGVLKSLVTGRETDIEPKGANVMRVRSHLHLILSSNHNWVVPAGIEPRRFCVLDIGKQRLGDRAYFEQVWRTDVGALLYDLQQHKITSDLRKAPVSLGLKLQQELSMNPEQSWLQSLVDRLECTYFGAVVSIEEIYGDFLDQAGYGARHVKRVALERAMIEMWGATLSSIKVKNNNTTVRALRIPDREVVQRKMAAERRELEVESEAAEFNHEEN